MSCWSKSAVIPSSKASWETRRLGFLDCRRHSNRETHPWETRPSDKTINHSLFIDSIKKDPDAFVSLAVTSSDQSTGEMKGSFETPGFFLTSSAGSEDVRVHQPALKVRPCETSSGPGSDETPRALSCRQPEFSFTLEATATSGGTGRSLRGTRPPLKRKSFCLDSGVLGMVAERNIGLFRKKKFDVNGRRNPNT